MRILQILMASTGIFNCLLVAVFLFFVTKGNLKANRIFSFLLFAICLKLAFALLINFPHKYGIPSLILMYLSEVGYLLFGPLLFIYIRTIFKKETSLFLIVCFVSFPVIFSFVDVVLNYNFPLWPCQVYFGAFLIAIFLQLKTNNLNSQKSSGFETDRLWLWTLFVSFVLIWVAVVLIIIDFKMYFFELCSIFTILFYIDSYIVVKHYWFKKGDEIVSKKYINSNLTVDEGNEIILRLRKLMDTESLYIDSEISLPKVAGKIEVKPYKLSQVINQNMNMTFNEYINFYRVNAIKNAMKLSHQDVKIASFASDYGFNSISSFNTAFKKFTNLTPSQYRNEMLMNSQN